MWPDADLDPEDAKNESPGQHRKDAFKREIEMMRRVGVHPNVCLCVCVCVFFVSVAVPVSAFKRDIEMMRRVGTHPKMCVCV